MNDVALLAQVLSSTTRLHILTVLSGGAASVTEVAGKMGVSHALASYHLGRLFEAHVVVFHRAGRRRVYARSEVGFRRLTVLMGRLA